MFFILTVRVALCLSYIRNTPPLRRALRKVSYLRALPIFGGTCRRNGGYARHDPFGFAIKVTGGVQARFSRYSFFAVIHTERKDALVLGELFFGHSCQPQLGTRILRQTQFEQFKGHPSRWCFHHLHAAGEVIRYSPALVERLVLLSKT